jgi:hypothetical protein
MVTHQEEPVPSPRDVTVYLAVTWHLNSHVRSAAITCYVDDRNFAAVVQNRTHNSDWGLDPVVTAPKLAHIGQRGDQPNRSVTAHPQIADIVEKDDAGGRSNIYRIAQQRAYHHIRTARFVDNRGAKTVVLPAKAFQPIGKRTGSEVGTTTHHKASGLTPGVGIDNPDALACLTRQFHSFLVPHENGGRMTLAD